MPSRLRSQTPELTRRCRQQGGTEPSTAATLNGKRLARSPGGTAGQDGEGRAAPGGAAISAAGRAPRRAGQQPAAGRALPFPPPAGPRRSPCCRRSGGAVPSRGPSSPPLGPRVVPAGEISRVLGRRSAPRSGSNCGPGVRQPSSRRVRGRRTRADGQTRGAGAPHDAQAAARRRPRAETSHPAGRTTPTAPLPPAASRLGTAPPAGKHDPRGPPLRPTRPRGGAGAAGSCSAARAAIPREAPSPLDGASSGPPCGATGLGPAWSAAVPAERGAVALPCVSTARFWGWARAGRCNQAAVTGETGRCWGCMRAFTRGLLALIRTRSPECF